MRVPGRANTAGEPRRRATGLERAPRAEQTLVPEYPAEAWEEALEDALGRVQDDSGQDFDAFGSLRNVALINPGRFAAVDVEALRPHAQRKLAEQLTHLRSAEEHQPKYLHNITAIQHFFPALVQDWLVPRTLTLEAIPHTLESLLVREPAHDVQADAAYATTLLQLRQLYPGGQFSIPPQLRTPEYFLQALEPAALADPRRSLMNTHQLARLQLLFPEVGRALPKDVVDKAAVAFLPELVTAPGKHMGAGLAAGLTLLRARGLRLGDDGRLQVEYGFGVEQPDPLPTRSES